MKKTLVFFLVLIASVVPGFSETKIVDLPLNSTSALVDSKGNLTAGGLIRRSDATYVNTAGALAYSRGTRTNLFTQSNDFSVGTGYWTQGSLASIASVTGPAVTGISSGTSLIEAAASAGHGLQVSMTTVSGTSYVYSIYAQAASRSWLRLTISGVATADTWFNLSSGVKGTVGSAVTADISSVGSGWYRCSIVYTATSTTTVFQVRLATANDGIVYLGDGTSYLNVAGAQLEALPSGNVIGSDLMDQEALGAELIANGDFSSEASWNKDAVWSISGGVATSQAGGGSIWQNSIVTAGKIYKAVFTVSGYTSGSVAIFGEVGSSLTASANGTYTDYFLAKQNYAFGIYSNNLVGSIDNVSVKEVTSPAKGQFHGTAMLAGSTELLTNGGAEADSDWYAWGTPTTNERSNEQAYLGTYSRKIVSDAEGDGFITATCTTVVGKLYKVTGYLYISALTATNIIPAVEETTGWTTIAYTTGISTTGSWQKFSFYFVATTTGSAVMAHQVGAGAATFYVDYVSVRQVQTTWTRAGTNTLEIDEAVGTGGALKITWIDDATGASLNLANASDQSADLVVGETYQVTFNSKVTAGSVTVAVQKSDATVLASVAEAVTASMTAHTLYFKATATATDKLTFSGMAATEAIWIDDLTIKSVPDLAYFSPGTYTATAGSTATIPAEPRFETNGLLVEGEATNFVTYSCDFTNAAWVKTNITPLKNQTGPDGVASSASLLTAGAANGTALFTVADGGTATNKTFSLWIKRVTGTGNIDLTDNNGTNWTTQSVTSTWTKFTLAARSQAIPIVGIRIVTSADAVAVCLAQNEISAYSTSGIYTNGCPVTRLTEAGSATNGYSWTMSTALKNSLGAASPSKGTMLIDFYEPSPTRSADSGLVAIVDGNNRILYQGADGRLWLTDAGGVNWVQAAALSANTAYTLAVRWDSTAASMRISKKSAGTWTLGTAATYDGSLNPGTSLRLAYGNEYPFWIKNVKFYDYWIPDTLLDVGGFGAKGRMQNGLSLSLH